MPYESINNLESAEIRLNENNELYDLDIAVFKDNTMNFTKFKNLPVLNKFQVDKKINEYEELMTNKSQANNFIGKIYVEDENGNMVPGNLKLDQIAEKIGKYNCTEFGVRIGLDANGDETSVTNHVIRKGSNIEFLGLNSEDPYTPAVSTLVNGVETPVENKIANTFYPWNEMEKVQISMDDTEINEDLSIDNGGNYFTRVPLYYIKQSYVIDKLVTKDNGNKTYDMVMDVTNMWYGNDPKANLDAKGITLGENESFAIYKTVCKYPLDGYRPAEFFVRKYTGNTAVVEDSSEYDSSIPRYVKVSINGREMYQLYNKFIESDLYSSTTNIKKYVFVTSDTPVEKTVLTNEHYFSCYEASSEEYNGKTVLTSKPNKNICVSTTLSQYRNYVNNIGDKYLIEDIKSYVDFYQTLINIEFNTLNSQSVINGVSKLTSNSTYKSYFNQVSSNFLILPKSQANSFVIGQNIISSPDNTIFSNNKISEISPLLENTDFTVERSSDIVVFYYKTSDGSFVTDSTQAVDENSYVKVHINTTADNSYIYAYYSEQLPTMPNVLPDGTTKEDNVYYYNGNLYGIVNDTNLENKKLYKVVINSDPVKISNSLYMLSRVWETGMTDILNSRTATIDDTGRKPFKWNWIENPYAHMYKILDGISIKYRTDENSNNIYDFYICNSSEKYNDTYDNYELVDSYLANVNTITFIKSMGFNPRYPWMQYPRSYANKINDSVYKDTVIYVTSSQTTNRLMMVGGLFTSGNGPGVYCYCPAYSKNFNSVNLGCLFERYGE